MNKIKNPNSKVKIMQENNTSAMPTKEDIDQAQFEADKRAVYKLVNLSIKNKHQYNWHHSKWAYRF